MTLESSPGSEGTENGTQLTEDGSPIFAKKLLTLSEAADILLWCKPVHRLSCGHVPQVGAKSQEAVTFLLDLMAFPEKLLTGDFVCDGYEPWDGVHGTSVPQGDHRWQESLGVDKNCSPVTLIYMRATAAW